MRKLEIADAEVMQLAIRQEIERSEEARYDHRLHGVLLVSSGQSCTEVGRLFGEAGTTIQRWVGRFERSGFAGLREGERSGRPRSLDAAQWRRIEADLRKSPREFGFEAGLWDGPILSEHLRRNHRVQLGVRQCQRLFRQMGFRLRKPRPEVAQSDPIRVAAEKNCDCWQSATTLSCGVWTNAISNSTDRAVACGLRRRFATRFYGTLQPANRWSALALSA